MTRGAKLIGLLAVLLAGPGCAALDEFDDFEFDDSHTTEYRREARPANDPPADRTQPGVYPDRKP